MLEMLRMKDVTKKTGYPKGSIYQKIGEGLFTRPVPMGARTAAWPKHEVETILQARIAGANDEAIRKLVKELMNKRQTT
jgi:prophage regulatory protein